MYVCVCIKTVQSWKSTYISILCDKIISIANNYCNMVKFYHDSSQFIKSANSVINSDI